MGTKKYSNLLCVKSIITIVITIASAVLTFVYPDQMMDTFKSAVTMVITFYFAHQTEKWNNNQTSKEEKS